MKKYKITTLKELPGIPAGTVADKFEDYYYFGDGRYFELEFIQKHTDFFKVAEEEDIGFLVNILENGDTVLHFPVKLTDKQISDIWKLINNKEGEEYSENMILGELEKLRDFWEKRPQVYDFSEQKFTKEDMFHFWRFIHKNGYDYLVHEWDSTFDNWLNSRNNEKQNA